MKSYAGLALTLLACLVLLCHFAVPVMSIDIVVVTCHNNSVEVKFSEQIAREAGYQMSDLHLNDPTCLFDRQDNDYYVQDIKPRNSCGSNVAVNNTHVTYSNSILSFGRNVNLPYSDDTRIMSITYECFYRIDLRNILAFSENVTYNRLLIPDDLGNRSVRVNMAVYEDNTYMALKESGTLLRNDTLYVGIAVADDVEDAFILMRQCWTSASQDPKSNMRVRSLFENGCPSNGSDKSNVIANGMYGYVLWNSKASNLVKDESVIGRVWIHCKISLCLKKNCAQACSPTRIRRVLRKYERHQHIISYGPLVVSMGRVKEHMDTDYNQSNSNATTVSQLAQQHSNLDASLLVGFSGLVVFSIIFVALWAIKS